MAGMFKLNFTEEDKTSVANTGGFEAIPTGVYECAVTDVELREVKSGPNQGKPYLNVELTIQNGDFNNRKLWASVMLFDQPKGNWFIAQFLKATGNGNVLETGTIPMAGEFVGKQVLASVIREKDTWKNDREPQKNGESWYKNRVNGFVTDDETVTTPKGRAKKNSLLP